MFNFFKKNKEETVKEFDVFAIVDGELMGIEHVSDPVFSQKMMGDGFAIVPKKGDIGAPCKAEVLNIFPTKHAIALKAGSAEILLHLGIDTVSLNGEPFEMKVAESDQVTEETLLAEVDIQGIKNADKDPVMMVIFTNGNDVIESFELEKTGKVTKGEKIGKIILK